MTQEQEPAGQAALPARLEGPGCVSDGVGDQATEEPDIRQAADSDPGRHQDRERRCCRQCVKARTCRGQRYHPDFFCICFFSQCEGEIPCQERFQGVFQDLKSYLPSSPHPADRGASFTPNSHL